MKMEVTEKYAGSVRSNNLKDDERHHNTDILAAMALSNELGSGLFRVKYANDRTAFNRAWSDFTRLVENRAKEEAWPNHINVKLVAFKALMHWIFPMCGLCQGLGIIAGTATNDAGELVETETTCPECNGTGEGAIVAQRNIIDYVADMVTELKHIEALAGHRARYKLGKSQVE